MREVLEYLIRETAEGRIDRKIGSNLAKLIRKDIVMQDDIAIIGVHATFPGAANADELWELLVTEKDTISSFPDNRKADVLHLLSDQQSEFLKGTYFDEIDKFDYKYFGLNPKEASLMDPNHRLFLEAVIHAIEDAGYGGERLKGTKTGVCVGLSPHDHLYKGLVEKLEPDSLSMSIEGNLPPILAGRVSYLLDLKGPNLTIDTACSSALSAVHVACNMIKNKEADQVIVGGVKTHLCPVEPKEKIGIESLDSVTRTFDETSNGTGIGEGVVVIILKPYSKAKKDKDQIYAVIKGSAINQDGKSIGLTAPDVRAQEDVIVNAWGKARVDPETISYIEAHGTGTKLGDPIEIEGINRAFSRFTSKKQFCGIGSIKSNLGHTDSLAGLAGLVKCVLALKHKQLPASLHFHSPNREIDFIQSSLYVNDTLKNWETGSTLRRCGVSAFGMSGSNCHIVLEEVTEDKPVESKSSKKLFVLSAKSEDALTQYINEYTCFLDRNKTEDVSLERICYTASIGKEHCHYRIAMIVMSRQELVNKLDYLRKEGLNTFSRKGIFYSHDQERGEFIYSDYLTQVASTFVQGHEVNWEEIYLEKILKVSLPAYPFEKTRCWVTQTSNEVTLLGKSLGNYSETEKAIAEIWSQTLGINHFHVNTDDFFELGGNSLHANILASKIRSELKVNVSVSNIFSNSTIERMVELVNQSSSYNESEIVTLPNREYYELSPAQSRLYRVDQLSDIDDLSYNMPFALSLSGNLDVKKLNRCWNSLVVRHESLRTTFIEVDGKGKQKIHPSCDYQIEVIEVEEQDVSEKMSELINPFDIKALPLFKLKLLQTSQNDYILFFDIHHIISDGVSISVLIQELLDLYDDKQLEKQVVQYKDFANWQSQQFEENAYKDQEQFWYNEYSLPVEELNLPTDFERPIYRSLEGDHYTFKVTEELTNELKRIAKEYKANMFSILLSAYQVLMYRYSNQHDIVIGCPVAGRQRDDVQRTVGMFVNMLPLRKIINSEELIKDFLNKTMEYSLNAFENQEYQIERLIEKFNIPYKTNRNPLYDVAFSYQNFDFKVMDVNEVKVKAIPFYDLKWNSSKFDLNLFGGMDLLDKNLEFCFQYSTELFKEETIEAFAKDYVSILTSFVQMKDGRIKDVVLEEDLNVVSNRSEAVAQPVPDFNF
ncbi:condensation domain-containing protein [Bacillus subtilis]|uniref:condensation domain-containing protein n=1 Tax=Bacillus subtilis TaxID=1423 RepID=UPI00201CC0A5|nr:condensation domain-containing protein [Bacillus subtilis]UQZ41906.1 polyketide synthase [Bacillus subtilis]